MSNAEWQTVRAAPLRGTFRAVCLGATEHTSSYGNPCIAWEFRLESGEMAPKFITPLHGSKSLLAWNTATALGLDTDALELVEAFGRRCRVTMKDGYVIKVKEWK